IERRYNYSLLTPFNVARPPIQLLVDLLSFRIRGISGTEPATRNMFRARVNADTSHEYKIPSLPPNNVSSLGPQPSENRRHEHVQIRLRIQINRIKRTCFPV